MAKGKKNIESVTKSFLKLVKNENQIQIDSTIQYIQNLNKDDQVLLNSLNNALAISKICIREINLDSSITIACLLYFGIKNHQITLDEIKENFDLRTSQIVSGLIKTPDIQLDKLNIQSENFIKLLLTISPDISSILIKLAEMLHQLRNLMDEDAEKQFATASVISVLYAPIAHRLGLYSIKTEMEDLSMKYLHTDTYKDIAKKLEKTKGNRDQYIKSFIAPLKKELD